MTIPWANPGGLPGFDPFNNPGDFLSPGLLVMALTEPEALATVLAKKGVRPGGTFPDPGLLPGPSATTSAMPTAQPQPQPAVDPTAVLNPNVLNPQSSNAPTPGGAPGVQSVLARAMQGVRAVQPPQAQFISPPGAGRIESPPAYKPNPQALLAVLQMLQGGQQQMPTLAQLMPR